MAAAVDRARRTKWWVISLGVILVAEGVVCALLFIPQAKALNAAKTNKAFVNKQFEKLRLTTSPHKYLELVNQIEAARTNLMEVNLFSEAPGQEVIMRAIARADRPGGVVVLALERAEDVTPSRTSERRRRRAGPKSEATDVDADLGEPWRMRCRSTFDRLVAFLNQIEQQGILLDSSVLSADTAAGDGTIEAEVLMRVFSRDALQQLKEQAAEKHKKKGDKGT